MLTKRAVGAERQGQALDCVRVEWVKGADGRMAMQEVPGSEFQLKADLVLLAMGFLGPRPARCWIRRAWRWIARGNVLANTVAVSRLR